MTAEKPTELNYNPHMPLSQALLLPRIAIVDPALTDHCPPAVTLASGLDALAQVIEPYVSSKATPFTDALTLPGIAPGLDALSRLMQGEDAAARDAMAWVSLSGGMALANGGLGAVHGVSLVSYIHVSLENCNCVCSVGEASNLQESILSVSFRS